jgi:hypothetical protein
MATHGTFSPDFQANTALRSNERPGSLQPDHNTGRGPLCIHLAYRATPAVSLEFIEPPRPRPGLRRRISREQGCALETIGHAVDYLNDSYLNEGPDDEILSFSAPPLEAARILVAAQCRLLAAMPLVEPLSKRIWNKLRLRGWRRDCTGVVPLTSAR